MFRDYFNPSLAVLSKGIFLMKDRNKAVILDSALNPMKSEHSHKVTQLESVFGTKNRLGYEEDCRIIQDKAGDLYFLMSIVTAPPNQDWNSQMGLRIFKRDTSIHGHLPMYSETHDYFLMNAANIDSTEPLRNQKSWSPFFYNSELHLLKSFHPTEVFVIPNNASSALRTMNYLNNERTVLPVEPVSHFSCDGLKRFWRHGEMRGGTPIERVNGTLFGFFHSSKGEADPGYYMGAFELSDQPPFRIVRISSRGIAIDKYFDSDFGPGDGYFGSCILFPMSFHQLTVNNRLQLTMALGVNDKIGYVVKFDFEVLYRSMVPTGC